MNLIRVREEGCPRCGLRGVLMRKEVLGDGSGRTVEQIVLVVVHGRVEPLAGFFSFEGGFKNPMENSVCGEKNV